jgi:hypothetical protein
MRAVDRWVRAASGLDRQARESIWPAARQPISAFRGYLNIAGRNVL